MAWTTPITFTAGNTLTAAQLNTYLRDNTNWLLNGRSITTKIYYKGADYNYVAVAAAWATVDNTNLKVTSSLNSTSGRYRVYAQFIAIATSTGSNTCEIDFDLVIDGTYYISVAMANNGAATAGAPNQQGLVRMGTFSANNPTAASLITLEGEITGLTQGVTHYVEIYKSIPQFNAGSGANTITIFGTNNPIKLKIEEI